MTAAPVMGQKLVVADKRPFRGWSKEDRTGTLVAHSFARDTGKILLPSGPVDVRYEDTMPA